MNILIVGNGFDLSHYLPTKYDNFMVAMQAIEDWDESQGEMGFDDLFGSVYWSKNEIIGKEWQNDFLKYTKAMYKTDEIKISVEKVKEFKKQLEENVWYQYFSDHVREVKTWIDFEQKIEEALNLVSHFIGLVHDRFLKFGKFNPIIFKLEKFNSSLTDENFYVSNLNVKLLIKLNLMLNNVANDERILGFINQRWLVISKNLDYGYDSDKYIYFLNNQLDKFIEIFNLYLELVIDKLVPICNVKIEAKEWISPNKIYSFNYTNTYRKFYDFVEIDYLHGNLGKDQNIVLGISELHDESLKKLKAYGFTKYHQKLLNDTDYQFLSENLHAINLKSFWQSVKNGKAITLEDQEINKMNIYIWGHSLGISDENYINEIFSFNTEFDEHVKVIIYYFNSQAKFELLANLIHILGKEKVEKWMKKGWLKFEKNPDIAALNNIEPVELPKISKA